MPVTTWNIATIDGVDYLVISVAQFRVPLEWDPSSNMFIAVAAPSGGLGNFPALVKGDPGDAAQIDSVINFTALDYSDSTPDSASFTTLSPGLYQLNLALHKGSPGSSGTTTIMSATDLVGTPTAGNIVVVNSSANGFVYATPKVGDLYRPAR